VLEAYILIQTPPAQALAAAEPVRAVPGVSETAVVLGSYNVIARAQARDMDTLAGLVTPQIQALSGVTRTTTCPVFRPHAPRHTRRIRRPLRAADGPLGNRGRRRVNLPETPAKPS
jgi:DNA-binding Lrp family transcriptional regulator